MRMTPARLLVVDDTASIRAIIRHLADSDPRLDVVGEAPDAATARRLIESLDPDVVTLDIEMPGMNGLDFLAELMARAPRAVVVVSSRATQRSSEAVRAMALGAIDCVDVAQVLASEPARQRLLDALAAAASAVVRPRRIAPPAPPPAVAPAPERRRFTRAILLGSSTGGADALERVLAAFPADCPPVLIAQHMPASFLASFARRLDGILAPRVRIAEDHEPLRPGTVLLAGGGQHHLTLARGSELRTRLVPATGQEMYVPEVDQLFRSAVPHAPRIVAGILTGMGRDGAAAMKALRDAGARTLAQSGESCVVDGMPRAAREAGAVERSLSLDDLGAALLARACDPQRARA